MPEEDAHERLVGEPSGAHPAPTGESSRRRLLAPLVLLVCLVGVGGAFLLQPDQVTRQVSDVDPTGHRLPVHEIDPHPSRPSHPAAPTRPAAPTSSSAVAASADPGGGESPGTPTPARTGPVTGHRVLAMRATVRTRAEQSAPGTEVLPAGAGVAVTGIVRHGWHQVIVDGRTGWVAGYALAPLHR